MSKISNDGLQQIQIIKIQISQLKQLLKVLWMILCLQVVIKLTEQDFH